MASVSRSMSALLVALLVVTVMVTHAEPTAATPSASVAFDLTPARDAEPPDGPVRASLQCDDRPIATTTLLYPQRPGDTRRLAPEAGQQCHVDVRLPRLTDDVTEVTVTVADGPRVLERHTEYTAGREVRSSSFERGSGDLSITLDVGSVPADEVGFPLRAMSFNIYIGGRLGNEQDQALVDQNLGELQEFVRTQDPDVLFVMETYGSGALIEDALNTAREDGRHFEGVQLTQPADYRGGGDNLWLYTWLPIEEIYPTPDDPAIDSFNVGGARLQLPGGGHTHVFGSWMHHAPNARVFANRAAIENVFGFERTDSEEEIAGTDLATRAGMAEGILNSYLATHATDGAPVVLGGDFNTMSHLDWAPQWADVPGHEGLTLAWPVSQMFEDAGFIDTFRWANPDVRRHPGRTMDTVHGFLWAPDRIDYLLARGDEVRVLGSHTVDRRLPHHRGGVLDDRYPFYSDHAAVITDLIIRGPGDGAIGREVRAEPAPERPWPEEPAGVPVPPSAMTATASSQQANAPAHHLVDGDPRTAWLSAAGGAFPHEVTIDMGEVRALSALRYQPRITSNIGMVVRAVLEASTDGDAFDHVTDVAWDRFNRPKDLDLDGLEARYLRLRVEIASGNQMAAGAELTPYEMTTSEPGTTDTDRNGP